MSVAVIALSIGLFSLSIAHLIEMREAANLRRRVARLEKGAQTVGITFDTAGWSFADQMGRITASERRDRP